MGAGKGLTAYRLALALLRTPALAYTAWRAARDGGRRYFSQRLGRMGEAPDLRGATWVHCASVGEVSAVAPLLRRWQAKGRKVVVTTVTPTGARQLARLVPQVPHIYLPLDYPGAVRHFVDAVAPRCGVIVETEIWPHLYAACAERGVRLVVINGRLSAKTLRAPAWLRAAYRQALGDVSAVLARSEVDAGRFVELGASPGTVEVLGNLKFAASFAGAAGPSPLPRPFVLAASTHDDEELQLAGLWRRIPHEGRVLALAPRHPDRRDAIRGQLKDFRVAVRSRGDAVTGDTEIYLVDTLGELPAFMAHAEVVFMGGSLVPRGGHNLLEAGALGAAVITGPHTKNFEDEVRVLREAGGVVQVEDVAGVETALRELLDDPARRAALGRAAQAAIAARAGVLDRYEERLDQLCGEA